MKLISLPIVATLILTSYSAFSADPQLAVDPKNTINLESMCLENNNSLDNVFYYDRRDDRPFIIPLGYSFVTTDIIVYPDCANAGQNATFNTLALVEDPQVSRKFTIRLSGTDTKHYALSGGLVFSAGSTPRPRNTTFSSGRVQIQLFGNLVRGKALNSGEQRF